MPARCYTKDLQQEYLTAWALRDGIDIFTPLNELSARYFPAATYGFPHSSPHPTLLALVCLPLTLMPFPVLVMLWLAINIALLIVVGRFLGLSVQGTLPLLEWPPLWFLLYNGNFELLILALAMLGWRAAAARRYLHAGR
jgi:alpha-1,2-mannosyltransferase